MANFRSFKKTKTCPRCNEKCDLTATKCTDCGLVFARLELGSNKLAKKKILTGKKDEVVYNEFAVIKTWPLFNKKEQEFADAYDEAIKQLKETDELRKLSEQFYGKDLFDVLDKVER